MQRVRVALLRHDTAGTRELAFLECEPRSGHAILHLEVRDESTHRERRRTRDTDKLNSRINRRDLIGIERVFDDAVEAKQIGEPGTVYREARCAERGRTQRRPIHIGIGPAQPFGIAFKRFRIGKHVMAERYGLRLYAHGIGGDNRIGITCRHIEQRCARIVEAREGRNQLRALKQAIPRRADVLPAAAGMHAGNIGPPAAIRDFSTTR